MTPAHSAILRKQRRAAIALKSAHNRARTRIENFGTDKPLVYPGRRRAMRGRQ